MIGSVGGGPGIGRAGWIEMVIVVEERGFAAVVAAAAAETEIETAGEGGRHYINRMYAVGEQQNSLNMTTEALENFSS